MRLRDTFKYFCWECWVFFIILSVVWLFLTGIFVIALFSGELVLACLMGLFLSMAAGALVWTAHTEAEYHSRGGI